MIGPRRPNTVSMGVSRATARARQAAQSVVSASQSAGRAGAAAASGTNRVVRKMTHASGAGRTGLAQLIELTAAGSLGDAFVGVGLAGTLFVSASVSQARDRVALALIITMAPFALLAPFVGPLLDRVQQGRRYIMIGTMLARGLLCWSMAVAVQHNDTLSLLPAAFGVLVLQKAYAVTRASVTPRLVPEELTLVTANSRCALATLIGASAGVPIAAGIDYVAGHNAGAAAWVLRLGTFVYLAGMVPGFRLPSGVDEPAAEQPDQDHPTAGYPDGQQPPDGEHPRSGDGSARPAGAGPQRSTRRKLFPRPVGPIVGEAIGANITSRAYSGFMIFFLAFLLRTVHFGSVSDNVALGIMAAGVAAGGFFGTAIGAAVRARAPQVILYTMLSVTLVVTMLCAVYFGLWAAATVAFAGAAGQTLVKLALDSIVQHEVSPDVRSSTFAASETLHQLSWVIGGLIGLLLSLTNSGVAGLAVAATGVAISLGSLLFARRNRILRGRSQPVPRTS